MKKLKMPNLFKPIVDNAKPALVGLAAVGAGAFVAQAGSALAKAMSAQVEEFASRSVWHEAGVDAVAGTAGAVVLTAGVGVWKGPKVAYKLAPLFLIGVGVSSAAPAVADTFERGVDAVVEFFGGTRTDDPQLGPAQAPSGFPLALPPDVGGDDFTPGGAGMWGETNPFAVGALG
jgi:hypothetical protein